MSAHGGSFKGFSGLRKTRSLRRGFMLVEAMMALSLLTVLGLVMLKLSLNILHPRQWVLQQTLSDAYLTSERATAERIPFSELLSATSPWPASPTVSDPETVEIGRLPGGTPITGIVRRTRFPDAENYPADGGEAVTAEVAMARNPAAMKVWKVQSILTYRIGNRTYAKSRTVLRSQ